MTGKRNNAKCLQCGLVNLAVAESCKRCGATVITAETREVDPSAGQMTNAVAARNARSSFRDVALMLSLIGAGFLAVVIGGALFLLQSESKTPRTFSSKAEQIQTYMDSYSEADCERNDRATSSP